MVLASFLRFFGGGRGVLVERGCPFLSLCLRVLFKVLREVSMR